MADAWESSTICTHEKSFADITSSGIYCTVCFKIFCNECNGIHDCLPSEDVKRHKMDQKWTVHIPGVCYCFECEKHISHQPRYRRFCFLCSRHRNPHIAIQEIKDVDAWLRKQCKICHMTHGLIMCNECTVCKEYVCTWCFHNGKWIQFLDDTSSTINIVPNIDDPTEYYFPLESEIYYVCSEGCREYLIGNYSRLLSDDLLAYMEHA